MAFQRRAMIDSSRDLPITEQNKLLSVMTSLYYKPVKIDSDDLMIKKCIDKIYTAYLEYVYRRICLWLKCYEAST